MLLYNSSSPLIWLAESADLKISSISRSLCVVLCKFPQLYYKTLVYDKHWRVLINYSHKSGLRCSNNDNSKWLPFVWALLHFCSFIKVRYQPRRVQLLEFGNTVILREHLLAPCIMHAVSRLCILENGNVSSVLITVLYYRSNQMQIVLGMMGNCCASS